MRKTYKMEVDCATCASKIEDALNKLDGVKEARVNFMTQKLILDIEGKDIDTILVEAKKIAKKVDRDTEIYA
ncbi:cation transporter [Dubosiella newyorkensis]|jgi:cation transport ATPase|uniref:Heavy metal transporter n=1 Tax=Dubosiella newyorkensis TaxID=1862672 RepID=A0A1U7NL13_9FIRM|nr:cation transporter [Dubosiella newyorkensis]MCI9040478.1 heavy-metal-associated domain-containing protein [Dubosiella newyorkensis]OLU45286.1 heavy metal transporter [Dubosiella newyorkensis]